MKKPDDYFDVDWRKGVDGGPVKQNLIHDVDTLRAFFGEGDIRHGCRQQCDAQRAAPRKRWCGLTFDSGAIVTIAFSDATPTPWGFEAGTGESPHIPKTAQTSMQIACSNGGLEFRP
jgi:predicted dehydrogenase